MLILSGVARGVAEATPIFQILFNKFGQKIWVNQSYLLWATANFEVFL